MTFGLNRDYRGTKKVRDQKTKMIKEEVNRYVRRRDGKIAIQIMKINGQVGRTLQVGMQLMLIHLK